MNHGTNKSCLTRQALEALKVLVLIPSNSEGSGNATYDPSVIASDVEIDRETVERILGKPGFGQNCQPAQLEKIRKLLTRYNLPADAKSKNFCTNQERCCSEKIAENEKPLFIKNGSNKGTIELIQEMRNSIKDIIKETCGKLRILIMSEPVDLDKIYINLQITEALKGNRLAVPKPFEGELKNKHLRLLVTGGIGSGKTTYLKNLAITCIDGVILPNQLPIHIVLREYIEIGKGNDLLEFIASKYKLDESQLKKLLNEESGDECDKCLFLFDGLDQVSEVNRDLLIETVREFVQKYPNNDYIISCRKISDMPLLENFEIAELNEMDDSMIEEFLEKRIKALPEKLDDQRVVSAPDLINFLNKKDNEKIKDLCKTPLMLALICLEYHAKDINHLNKNKWSIVQEAVNLWLEKWNIQQGTKLLSIISTLFIENLLAYIAYKTFEDNNLYLSKEKLKKYIRDYNYSYRLPPDRYSLDEYTDSAFEALEAVYGVTLKRNNNLYSFPHVIFRNYFGILYIGRNFPSLKDFKENVGNSSSNWDNLMNDAEEAFLVLF